MSLVSYGWVSDFIPDKPIHAGGEPISRKVMIAAGQGILSRGTVMGLITSSGQYAMAALAATNGSQDAVGILVDSVDTTAGAAEGLIFEEGIFIPNNLTYGPGHTPATVKASLRSVGIYLQPAIGG